MSTNHSADHAEQMRVLRKQRPFLSAFVIAIAAAFGGGAVYFGQTGHPVYAGFFGSFGLAALTVGLVAVQRFHSRLADHEATDSRVALFAPLTSLITALLLLSALASVTAMAHTIETDRYGNAVFLAITGVTFLLIGLALRGALASSLAGPKPASA